MKKTKVIIAQLGSPKSPSISDVRSYLREFLADPRVVDLPRCFWLFILYFFVLPFRPSKSAKAYKNIWDGSSFPLVSITKSLVSKLQKKLPHSIELDVCFLLSDPRINTILGKWNNEDENQRAQNVIIIPQFPQYSESTTASVFDVVAKAMQKQVVIPNITFIANFHLLKSFIDLTVAQIQETLNQDKTIDFLLISFHGIPIRRVNEKKDLYYTHCLQTFNVLRSKINFPKEKIQICFQSRFGKEEWLGPATNELAMSLAKQGAKKLAFSCPSFTVDCLETTVEIGMELREELVHFGTELVLIPALNDFDHWVEDLSFFIERLVASGPKALEELSYQP